MYNPLWIQFAGKHDYDKESAEKFSAIESFNNFSVGIFQWQMANSGKRMKRGKVVVRVVGPVNLKDKVFEVAESVVKHLDDGNWSSFDGRKTVTVK
jgi:hypothetical protein